jgi:hypothetical protein
MAAIRSFYCADRGSDGRLIRMTTERDRVISVSLSEAEWQAFVARHPQPVEWIRAQIAQALNDPRTAEASSTPPRTDTAAPAS